MATLTNTKIKDTYKSLLKVSDNGNLEVGLQEITDGEGNASGVQLNTGGDLTASGTVAFGSLKDSGENITIAKFVDEADGIAGNDNDTSIPTSAAVKDYVDTKVTAEDLDFAGDSGTGSVDLDSQTFTIAGTANEIETSASGQTITIGLPNDVNISGNLAVDTNTLYVDAANNRVGIGTSSPATDLDISSADGGKLRLTSTQQSWTSGDVISESQTFITDTGGIGARVVTNIKSITDVSGATVAGVLVFETSAYNSNVSEAMRIDSSGNVGIGTSSAADIIDVQKNQNATTNFYFRNTDTTNTSSRSILNVDAGNVGLDFQVINNDHSYISASSSLYVQAASESIFWTGGSERMRIDSSGNVGIGSSSPVSKLTLEGAKNTNTLTLRSTNNDSSWVSGDKFGSIDFYSNDNSAAGAGVKGSISYINDIGTSGGTTAMTFSTASTATNNIERMRIDSSGNVLIGETGISSFSSPNTLRVKGGIHTARGQFAAAGSTTTNIVTLANESKNQTYLLSVRQSGAATNNVMGYVIAFGTSASVIRMAQDNINPALDLNFTTSGLTLQLVTGTGYGSTTWDWVLTRLG